MLIDDDKICSVFTKVHNIREEYRQYVIGNDTHRIRIEDLQRVVENMYGLSITKAEVDIAATFFRGMMERWNDRIHIRILASQAVEWKRFTTVKEMCHVVIDEREDWSFQGANTIHELILEFGLESAPDDANEAKKVSQSEMLAEVAAIELMYPFEVRGGDIRRLTAGETTLEQIAEYHQVPPHIVGKAVADSYHAEVATPIWQMVTERQKAAE